MCMARTKQTARKNTGGKPVAMGRGKANPKKNPTPGRADRKVLLEYSSDEENPQQVEGAAAPKAGEEADTPDSANQPSPCDHD